MITSMTIIMITCIISHDHLFIIMIRSIIIIIGEAAIYKLTKMSSRGRRREGKPEREREEDEMGSYSFEREILIPISKEKSEEEEAEEPLVAVAVPEEEEAGGIHCHWGKDLKQEETWGRKTGRGVTLEGYVDGGDGCEDRTDGVARTKSLTGEDLEELKGCLDLGFGFNYDEIPELCNTLPALELCYSMSQRFLDEQQQQQNRSLDRSSSGDSLDLCESPSSPLVANWKIAGPGDDPDEVKARLKYWAQAVACTIRLCN